MLERLGGSPPFREKEGLRSGSVPNQMRKLLFYGIKAIKGINPSGGINHTFFFLKKKSLNKSKVEKFKKLRKDYILGFIDGEGSFYIIISKNKQKHNSYIWFSVTQKRKGILNSLKTFFGYGSVALRSNGYWELRITQKEDIKKLIQFFTKNSLCLKQKEFKLWKKAFYLKESTLEGFKNSKILAELFFKIRKRLREYRIRDYT